MNLDMFNNLMSNAKENNFVQNFLEELANCLGKNDNTSKDSINILNNENSVLKQEDCLYQVVQMTLDGAYLQNKTNNRVSKENDISKEVLEQIGNDSILRFKKGEYVYEEKLTDQFFEGLK